MRSIVERIEQMGEHRWPVLILGETGTGKELIARLIHSHGRGGPFIVVDCSAIPGNLMESELFGYVRGAFTGAAQTKIGLIEAADGGTAFFDEIGELPLDLQSRLLRVLQEKEFRPIGATLPRHSDFRVIAATNRDLAAEADHSRFRRDLYYRLKVVTLRLPPLRERTEDIPDLVRLFLSRYGCTSSISPEVMQMLLSYSWPGNVRELENCVQQMLARNNGRVLTVRDMPSAVINQTQIATSPLIGLAAATGQGVSPFDFSHDAEEGGPIIPLPELERREIIRAIRYTRGDRTAAATLLQIGRTTLYRKLKEYGVEV